MIDYKLGYYDFEDSLRIPQFRQRPTIVECGVELADGEAEVEMLETREEAEEREMLLRKLGSRPTSFPKAIGAGDFAGMIEDLKDARTMQAKAEVLNTWSEFFHGSMQTAMTELAEAILNGDEANARRLIARICAA